MGIKTYGEYPLVSIGLDVTMNKSQQKRMFLYIGFIKMFFNTPVENRDFHIANPLVSTGELEYPPHYFAWRF